MVKPQPTALQLAQREKRLAFFRHSFEQSRLKTDDAEEIVDLLNTYALLLAKMTKPEESAERENTEMRVFSIERRLNTLFEDSRLATSALNRRL